MFSFVTFVLVHTPLAVFFFTTYSRVKITSYFSSSKEFIIVKNILSFFINAVNTGLRRGRFSRMFLFMAQNPDVAINSCTHTHMVAITHKRNINTHSLARAQFYNLKNTWTVEVILIKFAVNQFGACFALTDTEIPIYFLIIILRTKIIKIYYLFNFSLLLVPTVIAQSICTSTMK